MHRHSPLALLVALVLVLPLLSADPPKTPPEGVLPLGADGKPLNLDFETGTLKDWTAEGDAFKGQPIKGDTVVPRRGDMQEPAPGPILDRRLRVARRQAAGHAHLGAVQGHASLGVVPRRRRAVAGHLRRAGAATTPRRSSRRTSGLDEENLRRVAVDLTKHMGKEIFIRLVDQHSGGWGHINFDDFRFHSDKPNVPPRKDAPPPPDVYKYAGLPPEKAAAGHDRAGRLRGQAVRRRARRACSRSPCAWTTAAGSGWPRRTAIPFAARTSEGKDRIVIFEDTDGDGHFDKRTVFMEG